MTTFRDGWRDRLKGRDYNKKYDSWTYTQQIAYEYGRRAAAVCQHHHRNHKQLHICMRMTVDALPAEVRVDALDEKRIGRNTYY